MQIDTKNISKTYSNGVHASQKVSLNIGKCMFSLLGPNGAGKISIMWSLAALKNPDEGDILFNGRIFFLIVSGFVIC